MTIRVTPIRRGQERVPLETDAAGQGGYVEAGPFLFGVVISLLITFLLQIRAGSMKKEV